MAPINLDIAETFGPAAAAPRKAPSTTRASGLAQGTRVMTLDGAIPVEFLNSGDRIITRSGMRRLARIEVTEYDSLRPCRISAAALGHDRPEADIEVGPATPVHIRDWRAKALYGKIAARVDAGRLADGEYVSVARQPRKMRLFTLIFDTHEIFYAEGLEIASAS